MTLLPLIVAQYELKGHPTRTEHWNLVVLASKTSTHTLEVRGNTDSFTYVPELNTPALNRIITYRGGCHVGDIPKDAVQEIIDRLREVPIVRHDQAWDCQVWVWQAVKLLKNDGFTFAHVEEATIREELAKDMARWEEADDTVDERLLSVEPLAN